MAEFNAATTTVWFLKPAEKGATGPYANSNLYVKLYDGCKMILEDSAAKFTVSIIEPEEGETVSGVIAAEASVTDENIGVQGTEFYVDGANMGRDLCLGIAPPHPGKRGVSIDTRKLSDGSHEIHAVVMLARGGPLSESKKVTFRVKNTSQILKELTLDLGNNVAMKLVLIPAGKFIMGSAESTKDEPSKGGKATPHEVTISKPFYMGIYPVTQGQYEQVIGNRSPFQAPLRPITGLNWFEAVEFCEQISMKMGKVVLLPTEAQWEYACRAGTTTRFSFGDDPGQLKDYGWTRQDSVDAKGVVMKGPIRDVGKLKPNPWGLYDMHGNVSTWCADWYAEYGPKAAIDPQGPDYSGQQPTYATRRRVARGGSYSFSAEDCTSSSRHRYVPMDHRPYSGIRVVVMADSEVKPVVNPLPVPSAAPKRPAAQPSGQLAKEPTLDLGNAVTMKLALIPAGKFTMGNADPRGSLGSMRPVHEVTITKPFYMGIYEVTQGQYAQVTGKNPSRYKGDKNRPVEQVTWFDAAEYCKMLSAKTGKAVRLPTEAEWEYAVRPGSPGQFPGQFYGNMMQHIPMWAWAPGKMDLDSTYPVGLMKVNDWGLYDVYGNVFEWCRDWYADYDAAPAVDPQGPTTGKSRMKKGGSFYAGGCGAAERSGYPPEVAMRNIGFRVVVDAQ